jgi:signal transduction histidine kinase
MPGSVFDFAIGVLEVALGAIVLAQLWRFRRGFPWLIALTSFFFLRGADRIAVAVSGSMPTLLGSLVDPLIVVVLLLLLFSMGRIIRSLELAEEAAQLREREYARALVDYRRLARHRLATPLTAILGSARFLQELDPKDVALRSELLEIMEEAARRLEQVSLDPGSELAADERSLRPIPSVRSEHRERRRVSELFCSVWTRAGSDVPKRAPDGAVDLRQRSPRRHVELDDLRRAHPGGAPRAEMSAGRPGHDGKSQH